MDEQIRSNEAPVNPYAPTIHTKDHADRDTSRRPLDRASRLYARMGWIGLAYFGFAFPIGLWSGTRDTPFQISLTTVTGLFVLLFVSMIRLSRRIRVKEASVYYRARWTGLLAAAFGFPFLTVTAFYAVWLLEKGYKSGDTMSESS